MIYEIYNWEPEGEFIEHFNSLTFIVLVIRKLWLPTGATGPPVADTQIIDDHAKAQEAGSWTVRPDYEDCPDKREMGGRILRLRDSRERPAPTRK